MISYLFGRESRSWKEVGTLRNPSPELVDLLGAEKSAAGVSVDSESALKFPPVWRATNLIASHIAKVPCHIYQRQGEGKERIPSHPAYWLIRRKSSRYIPVFFFRYALTANALLRGNGYALIVRARRSGPPVELIPLDAGKTWPVSDRGSFHYVTQNDEGAELEVDPIDMLHIRMLSDGIQGYSVIEKARESLGSGLASQEYEGRFFSNNARPSSVIESPRRLGPEAIENLRRSWMEIYGGLRNAHKPGILEEGAQLKVFGMSNADAQFVESRQAKVREVANWFGVPPHKLGDDAKSSYNSLEQENQSFLDDCLDSWFCAWEAELWDKLLSDEEKRSDEYEIEFLRQALVRADLKARSRFYHDAILDGWMSRDEVRAKENMNPIPDGSGSEFLVPLNMAKADELDQEGEDEGEEEREDREEEERRALERAETERRLLSSTLARMARRIGTQAERAARKPERWLSFVDELLPDQVFRSATEPVAKLCGIDPEGLAEAFYSAARREFDACADVTPAKLSGAVEAASRRLSSEIAGEILTKYSTGANDGT